MAPSKENVDFFDNGLDEILGWVLPGASSSDGDHVVNILDFGLTIRWPRNYCRILDLNVVALYILAGNEQLKGTRKTISISSSIPLIGLVYWRSSVGAVT